MRRPRTLLTSVAAAGGLVLALTSCTSPDPTDPVSDEPSGSVTLWMYPVITDQAASQEFWGGVEDDFEKKYPDVDLTIELQTWDKRNEQVTSAIASGTGPDVVLLTIDQISSFNGIGGLLPVDEAISDEKDLFYPDALKSVTFDDELYGIPIFYNATSTLYNKALFEAAGIDELPTTWDEILEDAPKLAAQGVAIFDYAGNPKSTLNLSFYPLLWQAGGTVFTEDGTDVAFDSDAGVSALQFLLDLQKVGGLSADAATGDLAIDNSDVAAGQVAMRPVATLDDFTKFKTYLGDSVVMGAPLTGKVQVAYGTPAMLGLTTINKDQNRAAAYALLNYIASPTVQLPLIDASNRFPSRTDITPSSTDPAVATLTEALTYAIPGETNDKAVQVMTIMSPYIQAALQGKMTAREALEAAAGEARALLGR